MHPRPAGPKHRCDYMQDAPVPSNFRQPTCRAVADAGAPKVVAGRYSSRDPLVRNCNCNSCHQHIFEPYISRTSVKGELPSSRMALATC